MCTQQEASIDLSQISSLMKVIKIEFRAKRDLECVIKAFIYQEIKIKLLECNTYNVKCFQAKLTLLSHQYVAVIHEKV